MDLVLAGEVDEVDEDLELQMRIGQENHFLQFLLNIAKSFQTEHIVSYIRPINS